MKKIIALVLGFFIFFEIGVFAQTLTKHPDNESVSRHFVLENGLKVLLVSDPEFNVSAAALEIQAGSLMDPKDRQGLAHFLEHMLFLGTKKYPNVEDYSAYLKSHGGYSNAFTGEDRTNYHFEIQHDAFDGALDRFSQFFISPLFSSEYSEREINAVHSEHQKNLEQDDWREHQLFKKFFKKEHPANHFATGNLETLNGVKQEEFIQFYKNYYSANKMSLVLLSNKGIGEMEALAKQYFLPIKNNHQKKLTYDPDYLDTVEGFRLIKRLPVKDLRELTLTFEIPSFIENYNVKPEMLIGFCMGHEGKGSLLSFLKNRGLATGLGAGGGYNTPDYGRFSINIKLTQKGLENYRDVIRYCFSYIHLLKEKGISPHIFNEIQRVAELDYTYKNRGEGSDLASHLAGNMNRYPIELAETVDYSFETLDQGLVESVLNHLRPNNMICILTARGLETDRVEPYYGTQFSYNIEKEEYYNSLLKPSSIKELSLPAPNPFLPDNVSLLAERPVNIINEPGLELWYAQDVTFKRPKVSLMFRIQHSKALVNPAYMSRLSFYTACVNETLNEIAYPAREAGLDYEFSADLDGISIIISGYTASTRMLLNKIGEKLKKLDISKQQFADIKDRKLREWKNFKMGQAWEIARHISRRIRKETYFSIDDLQKESESLSLKELNKFTDKIYSKTRIQGLVNGNISAEEAISLTNLLKSYVQSDPLKKEDIFKQHILVEKKNDPLTYIEKLETNNSCFWRTIHLGSETPELRIAARIIEKFISQLFYTEMRTKQQLGYIVMSAAPEDNGQHYLFFIVQSESHPADEIGERVKSFINNLPSEFESLSDIKFAEFKSAIRSELLEKPKSILEKSILFDRMLFEYNKDFERRQDNLDALKSLTKAQVAKMLSDTLNHERKKIVDILLFAKQHSIKDENKPSIESIDLFKAEREFIARPEK